MLYEKMIDGGAYYGPEANRFLQAHLDQLPLGKILCIAEDDESSAVYLAKQGYDVTVLEHSLFNLTKLNNLAKVNAVNVTEIFDDIAHFDFGISRWDGIVYLSHCNLGVSGKTLLRRFLAGLKPNGVLILETIASRQFELEKLDVDMAQPIAATPGRLKLSHLTERDVIKGFGESQIGKIVQAVGSVAE